ncbi:Aspartyl/glutamyl-tRNA(Asn/Gln) amidotransferase subunit C [Planctomycetales bacterium 10988]|nr:Aspartyl/glutamyl-tRNA(Asn/Gln) amidotransferase subunit C [Planctomycetales bacterium 10988]
MELSRDDIAKVALLSRLQLNDEELDAMQSDLQNMVNFVEQLGEVDTDGVEPMAHAVELHNIFREDKIAPSLPREEALANAPDEDGEFYRVPAVLGD